MKTEEKDKTNRMGQKKTKTSKKSKSEAAKLKEKNEILEQELEESKDKYLRLYAEFDNYKKRTIREKLEIISTASRDIMVSLLPVLDDFDRAKKSADDENTKEVFSEGVKMVYQKLKGLLKAKGLEVMDSENVSFDPEFHEAITEIPASDEKMKGKVVDTVEKGYLLNNKIIRHAKVVVGK